MIWVAIKISFHKRVYMIAILSLGNIFPNHILISTLNINITPNRHYVSHYHIFFGTLPLSNMQYINRFGIQRFIETLYVLSITVYQLW